MELGLTAELRADNLLPFEAVALSKAWRTKERRESKRFADVLAMLGGGSPSEYLPPTEESVEVEKKKQVEDQKLMAAAIKSYVDAQQPNSSSDSAKVGSPERALGAPADPIGDPERDAVPRIGKGSRRRGKPCRDKRKTVR